MPVFVERKHDQVLVFMGENTLEARRHADRAERMSVDAVANVAAAGAHAQEAARQVDRAEQLVSDAEHSLMITSANAQAAISFEGAQAVLQAQAWAQGTAAPDAADPQSRSARKWAEQAAQSSSAAEAFSGPTYSSLAAGLSGTIEGGNFAVSESGVVSIYRKHAGAAVLQRTTATTAALAAPSGANLTGVGMDQAFGAGTVGAHLRWTPLPQDAPWFCDPTATVDCTAALQAYFDYCAANRLVATLRGGYRISSTIVSNVRAIDGGAPYQDSGNPGSFISFTPATMTDLIPAIDINGGMASGGTVRGLRISGPQGYTMRDAPTWCPNPGNLPLMSAFADGPAGFRIGGINQVVFDSVSTRGLKCGRIDDSTHGHIWSYDCQWNGWLAGVYCKRNSEDYRYINGAISGTFSNFIFGTILHAGHYGGMNIDVWGTHLGFSPYIFYQINDGNLPSSVQTLGVYGVIEARMEQVGEAILCELDQTLQAGLEVRNWNMGWSTPWTQWETASPGSVWATNLHPWILPYAQQQQFAFRIGKMDRINLFREGNGFGSLAKSPHSSTSSRIARVATWSSTVSPESDFGAFKGDVEVVQYLSGSRIPTYREGGPARRGDLLLRSDVLTGNLLKNPELAANWTSYGGAPVTIINAEAVGLTLPQQMIDELGVNPAVIMVGGTAGGVVSVKTRTATILAEPGRKIGVSFWLASSRARTRLAGPGGVYYYDSTTGATNGWFKVAYQGRSLAEALSQFELICSNTGTTYHDMHVAGLMMFYDDPKPYNNSPSVKLAGLPTSAAGLPAGSLWNNSGVLNVV